MFSFVLFFWCAKLSKPVSICPSNPGSASQKQPPTETTNYKLPCFYVLPAATSSDNEARMGGGRGEQTKRRGNQ